MQKHFCETIIIVERSAKQPKHKSRRTNFVPPENRRIARKCSLTKDLANKNYKKLATDLYK